MADSELLARLDRLTWLLAALLGVEILKLLAPALLAFPVGVVIIAVVGFVLLWGRSVVGLVFGTDV